MRSQSIHYKMEVLQLLAWIMKSELPIVFPRQEPNMVAHHRELYMGEMISLYIQQQLGPQQHHM